MQNFKKITLHYNTDKKYNLLANEQDENLRFKVIHQFDFIELEIIQNKNLHFKELRFEIEFNEIPISWRNHDYTWVNLNKSRISNELSPKILKFKDDNYLMSNRYLGVWEMNPKNKRLLNWHIHHSELSPFFILKKMEREIG